MIPTPFLRPQFALLGAIACLGTLEAAVPVPNLSLGRLGQIPYVKESSVVEWTDGPLGSSKPVPENLTGVTLLAAGFNHVLAMKADGTVIGWGDGYAATTPPGIANAKGLACSSIGSAAILPDNAVTEWGNPQYLRYSILGNVTQVAGGLTHFVALRADRGVSVWGGSNRYGELNMPAGLQGNAIAIAAGSSHSLALKQDGSVVAWGRNHLNQCSVPSSLNGVRVKGIACGSYHSLALKEDGTVVAWGFNFDGQCSVPPGLANVREIHAGESHSVAVTHSGQAYFWGKPQTEKFPAFPRPKIETMAASGSQTFAAVEVPGLADFGNVAKGSKSHLTFVLGNNGDAAVQITSVSLVQPVAGFSVNNTAIPGGLLPGRTALFTASFAPTSDDPQTAVIRVKSNDPIRPEWDIVLAANGYQGKPSATNLGLTTQEDKPLNLQLAGTDLESDPLTFRLESTPPASVGIVTLSNPFTGQATFTPAKNFHGEASFTYVVNDGGSNSEPATVKIQVTPVNDFPVATYMPTTITVFTRGGSVPVHFRPPVFVDPEDGELTPVMTWRDGSQPFSSGTVMFPETHTIVAKATDSGGLTVSRSFMIHVMARYVPGIEVSAPGMSTTPPDTTFLEWNEAGFLNETPANQPFIKQISYGRDHAFALRNDGSLVGWGAAELGQLGAPPALWTSTVTKVACGLDHTVALTSAGKVIAWGPDTMALYVSSFGDCVDIAAGADFSMGLRGNGTLRMTEGGGSGNYSLYTKAATLTDVKAIAAGAYHALALKQDGSVFAWGRNTEGQTSVPSSALSGVVAIAAGPYHSMALKSNGTVVTWGRTPDGKPAPTITGSFSSISAGWYHNLGKRTSDGVLASWGRFTASGVALDPNLPGIGVPAEVAAAKVSVAAAGNGRSAAALALPPNVIDFGQVPLDGVLTRTITIRSILSQNLAIQSVERASGNTAFSVDTTGMSGSLGQNQSTSFTVKFDPQFLGASSAVIRVLSNDPNQSDIRIEVRAEGLLPAEYSAWAWAHGPFGTLEEPESILFKDGLANVVKFAFNLDPKRFDYRILTAGSGTAGLPSTSLEQSGGQRFLRVEYLRRKSGSVGYHVEHSSTLQGNYQEVTATPEIFPIDEIWERAVVRHPVDPEAVPKGFVRVRVSLEN